MNQNPEAFLVVIWSWKKNIYLILFYIYGPSVILLWIIRSTLYLSSFRRMQIGIICITNHQNPWQLFSQTSRPSPTQLQSLWTESESGNGCPRGSFLLCCPEYSPKPLSRCSCGLAVLAFPIFFSLMNNWLEWRESFRDLVVYLSPKLSWIWQTPSATRTTAICQLWVAYASGPLLFPADR